MPLLVGAGEGVVDALYREVLAVAPGGEDTLAGRSSINNDGTPLQLCLSASRRGWGLRLIGDPGADRESPEDRYRCSAAALRQALASTGAASLAPLAERTLDLLVPATAEGRAAYRDGFLWLASSPGRRGIAFYVEAAPLGQAGGWDMAERWLAELLPTAAHAAPLLAGLRARCVVASLGLEGSELADTRAKIYFRLARPMALGELGIDLLASPELGQFLETAMGERGVDLDGLVLCIGFNVATGELADAKIDLCGHCLAYADGEWLDLVARCCGEGGLAPPPVRNALATGDCEVAFVGCGVDAGGGESASAGSADRRPDRNIRLNVYLKGRARQDVPCREELEAAVCDAIGHLCRLQEGCGRWTDYQLPVGASDQWVTAYVGLALAQAGGLLGREPALAAAGRGAGWLTGERAYPAGWGYNATTGPDSDSTAMALALQRALGLPPRAEDQAFLRRQWRPEGGLATFPGPRAWGNVHWDVTPVGYLGLSGEDQRSLRASFLDGLQANRMRDGMWRSYWWRRPYYSTLLTLEALSLLGLPEPGEPAPRQSPLEIDNAFDLACVIGVELFREASPERLGGLLRSLLGWQQADGSWPGYANLRVTDDTCAAPWDEPAGDYYADQAATITTATALRVIGQVLRLRGGAGPTDHAAAPPPAP